MKLKTTLALLPLTFVVTSTVNAAITSSKDSSTFAYQYEMDVKPSTQDLDGNTTVDWFNNSAGGAIIPQTYSGGLASSNQAATAVLFRTDFGGSITRNTLAANTPYTMEITVNKVSGTQGSQGWFAIALQSPGTAASARFSFKDDRVTFRTTGGTFTEYLAGNDFTTGSHTVRIAYEGSNSYYVWVDGVLLNADLSTPILGGNGSFNTAGSWLIGDFSGDTGGDWQVDHIRFDATGAYDIPTVSNADLVWTASQNSTWDLETTANWELLDTTPVTFSAGDSVLFDDSAASGSVVISGGTVNPGEITFDNSVINYTVSGDAWSGIADLVKTGTSQTTLLNAASHSGSTTITGGILRIGDGGSTGSIGSGPIVNDASLVIQRDGAISLANNISGTGSVTVAGPGVTTLSGTGTYDGATTVSGGTLRIAGSLTSAVTVQSGASISAAPSGTVGALTLDSGSKSSFNAGFITTDTVVVSDVDGLSIGGPHSIDLIPNEPWLDGDQFVLIDYNGTPVGDVNDLQVGDAPHGVYDIFFDGVNEDVVAEVILLDTLVWKGNVDSTWDLDNTANWALLSDNSSVPYFEYDQVIFNDSAATGSVSLASGFTPGSVVIANSSLAYVISGVGVSGYGIFEKSGTAAATWTAANSMTGGVNVLAGSMTFGDGATSGEIGFGTVSVAAGATLTLDRSDLLDYKATAKLRNVAGEGDFVITGGGTVFNYTGGGTAFVSTGTWSDFLGDLIVKGGSEFQTIRNGSTAMGAGSVILGDGSSSGSLSQIEGNWAWTTPIQLAGAENRIINRSVGAPRTLKLQGVISGSGGLTFEDATGAMNDINLGFVLTAGNTMSGVVSIDAGVPVRVGSVPGEVAATLPGLVADAFGSLGTAAIVNNGTLTFSRTDAHAVANSISGTGALRVGLPAAASLGDTSTQVLTYTGTASHSGATTVENGALVIGSGGSMGGSSVTVAATGLLGGVGTVDAPVNAAGTIAPGTSVGTLSVNGDTALTGTLAIEVDGATGDQLVVTGALDLSGSTLTVAEPGAGFTEASYVIAQCTGALTGLPAVPVGYAVNAVGSQVVLTKIVGSGYDTWISGFSLGGLTAIDDDPDQDGIDNGLEFLLKDGNPEMAGSAQLPTVSATGANLVLVFERDDRAKGVGAGVTVAVEASTDLSSWPDLYTVGDDTASSSSGVVISNDGDANPDTVTVTIPKDGAPVKFARIKVLGNL